MNNGFETWVENLVAEQNKSKEKAMLNLNIECIKTFEQLGMKALEYKEKHNLGDEFYSEVSKALIKANGNESRLVFEVGNIKDCVKFHVIYGDYLKRNPDKWNIVGSLHWHCHKLILIYVDNLSEALFYVQKGIDNNWDWHSIKKSIESRDYYREIH